MAEYIDREALLKAMSYHNYYPKGKYFLKGIETAEGIIEHFPAADVQPVKWIPVTERLPEENGRYLTVMYRTVDPEYIGNFGDDDTEVRITRYYKSEWIVPKHHPEWINEVITDTVTHWMPLPEPPKDGNA